LGLLSGTEVPVIQDFLSFSGVKLTHKGHPLCKRRIYKLFYKEKPLIIYNGRPSSYSIKGAAMVLHVKKYRIFLLSAIFLPISITISFAANYTLTVNAGSRQGSWNKFYERCVAIDHMYTVLSSAYGRNCAAALKKGHDEAGFQYCRGHGILDADVNVYTEDAGGNAVYNWTNFDKIYDAVKDAGMRPIFEIGFMPPALASASTTINNVWYNGVGGNWNAPKDWNKWEALVREIIRHCKERYGVEEVRNNWFFELWNEPNWMYGGGGGYTGWKTLYQHTAAAVMAEDPQIKLGGPAESGGSSNNAVPDFMQWTKQNNIKADFCSYHIYSNDAGNPSHNGDAMEPCRFHKLLAVVQKKAKNFAGLLLNTEYGPSYTSGIENVHDGELAASYAAKSIHLFNLEDSTETPPPYALSWWTLSDIYEEYDNRNGSPAFSGCYGMLTRGISSIPQSCDVAKPAFNAFKMLHMLKDYKLSCTGGTTASPGVNAAATISAGNDTIGILVYNHVDNPDGNSSTVDNVTLAISNIPFSQARVEHWLVDKSHSNSYQAWVNLGRPQNPSTAEWTTIANAANLQQYDSVTTVTISNGSYTKSFPQNHYSVGLIQLTRAGGSPVLNPTIATLDIAAMVRTRFAGTKLTIDIPVSGRYAVALYSQNGQRVKSLYQDGPGKKEVSLKGLSAGAYILECVGRTGITTRQIMVGTGR
jgi:xylan 1,4-beta-xylosidase